MDSLSNVRIDFCNTRGADASISVAGSIARQQRVTVDDDCLCTVTECVSPGTNIWFGYNQAELYGAKWKSIKEPMNLQGLLIVNPK
jgi:hypothetical protein